VEAHRPKAPKLFDVEFAEARRRIAEKPDVESVYAVRAAGVIVRRVLRPKTRVRATFRSVLRQ